MMRRFTVTVNGVSYDVEVEENNEGTAPAPAVQTAAPAAPKAAPAAPQKPAAPAGKNAIKAPFPGTVLKVNVSAGASVKKGDVLCVIEAMKMENDISAPEDGVVGQVLVSKGATVATDDVLLTLA